MGEVVRVTDRGIAGCDTFMKYGVLYIGPSIAEAFAVCVLFYVHFKLWALSVLVFASVFLYAALTIKLTLWRKRFRSAMNKSDNAWHDRLTDSLVNFETVKYFTAERYECDRFAEQIASYQKSSVEVQASLSALNISQQTRTPAVAANAWVINLFAPLNFLGTVYNALITALVDLKNLSELLAQKPWSWTRTRRSTTRLRRPLRAGLAVAFEDVVFRYPGVANVDSGLRGVSFHVDAGSSLGVCGPTGAGKSTRAVAVPLRRFGGRVTVGGVDVRAVSQGSLRRLMGVVPQDTVLFNASLDYNIRYGKRGATELDRDEAAGRASLLPFVSNLEESWETVVGERGLKLSGGEKQRVAIARLFVKNPPVVILDEATSALDSRTEADIQDALTALSDTRTAVTIAHRLGTIAKCDAILVLKDGEVAERGAHDALIALKGEYAAMWEVQAKTNDFLVADETKEEAKAG
ncbi:ABC transporter [Aureococcus anophagefferens]|nr:ABC transporter [Aureococcus anophagefferens]